eukprot:3099254-Rhodomonas_salina.1
MVNAMLILRLEVSYQKADAGALHVIDPEGDALGICERPRHGHGWQHSGQDEDDSVQGQIADLGHERRHSAPASPEEQSTRACPAMRKGSRRQWLLWAIVNSA